MLVKLIGGPLDGAEYDSKHGDVKQITLPVPAREPRSGYDSVSYFRKSETIYVWEGMKDAGEVGGRSS